MIDKIAIIGAGIVTNETEALEAARIALDWNGSSEEDFMAEVKVRPSLDDEYEECAPYEVVECWGSKSRNTNDYAEAVASFTTAAEAQAYVDEHNAKALAAWASPNWITLPKPIECIDFNQCRQGTYPQSRIATITVEIDGEEHEFTGYGQVRFYSDTHSHTALHNAVQDLVKFLEAAPVA